jgi:WD40 repeat protein
VAGLGDGLGLPETVEVMDEGEAEPVRSIIQALAFSGDGTVMATVGGDRRVRVWDVERREQLHALGEHAAFTRGVAFGPDGTALFSSSDDGTVRRWDAG